MNRKSYFRPAVDAMAGYVPGEQPRQKNIIKINTNENPYLPSPEVGRVLQNFDLNNLRRYPDPTATELRTVIAQLNNVNVENVIAGNGSDDILTMVFRAFTSPELPVATLYPTYSLYFDLAAMQEARVIKVELHEGDFSLPENPAELANGANLFIITRPNAPTGNSFPLNEMEKIVQAFDGIVLFDEAYADFAGDSCMPLAVKYPNVIVMRTLSKSYALAGMRAGYAVASKTLIDGLMKLKDSYNLDAITQAVAAASLRDQEYFRQHVEMVKASRKRLTEELENLNFSVVPSQTNFVFAAPPDGDGKRYFEYLKKNLIFVRYFPADKTKSYVRISVGTPEEINTLIDCTRKYLQ